MPPKKAQQKRTFTQTGPRLTTGKLKALEQEVGTDFPKDYRKFLLKTNGGVPEPGFFTYKRGSKPTLCWVESFASVTDSKIDSLNFRGTNAALWRWHVSGTPCPAGAIAIGSAGPYASILLFIAEPNAGEVWLKDWEAVDSRVSAKVRAEDGLYRLAPTFDAFLKLLCDEETAEASLKAARKR